MGIVQMYVSSAVLKIQEIIADLFQNPPYIFFTGRQDACKLSLNQEIQFLILSKDRLLPITTQSRLIS